MADGTLLLISAIVFPTLRSIEIDWFFATNALDLHWLWSIDIDLSHLRMDVILPSICWDHLSKTQLIRKWKWHFPQCNVLDLHWLRSILICLICEPLSFLQLLRSLASIGFWRSQCIALHGNILYMKIYVYTYIILYMKIYGDHFAYLHFCFTMVLNLQCQSSIQCRFFATIIGERLTLLISQNLWRLSLGSVHIWKLKMCLWLQLNGRYHHLITKLLIKAQWLLPSFNYLKHIIRFKQIYICL